MALLSKQKGFAGIVILSGLVLSTLTTGFFVSQSGLLEPNIYNQPYHAIHTDQLIFPQHKQIYNFYEKH